MTGLTPGLGVNVTVLYSFLKNVMDSAGSMKIAAHVVYTTQIKSGVSMNKILLKNSVNMHKNTTFVPKRKRKKNKTRLTYLKKKASGAIKDTVQPLKSHIWPNQAMPNSLY